MISKIFHLLLIALLLTGLSACVRVTSYNSPIQSASLDSREPHTFLENSLNFSEREILAMEQGEVVAKVFDISSVENEVGAFGVVRLNIPKESFVEQFRDIETFTESDAVEAIGKFSNPPRLEDLQRLTLDADDIDDLKKCRPGACKLKMDRAMMERFQQDIDWDAPNYQEQVTALMRRLLFDYVTDYLDKGDAALGEYHDQAEPVSQSEAFQDLLKNSAYIKTYVPELYSYLRDFPYRALPNAETFLYWSQEYFGLKSVVNLFHVTIYTRERYNRPSDVFIASKQIYANHYFETSLGFTAFVSESGCDDSSDAYLMYLNRSRFDQLRGKLKGVIVSIAKGSVYDGVKTYFRLVKERLESEQLLHHLSRS